jgi:hypothetical protein
MNQEIRKNEDPKKNFSLDTQLKKASSPYNILNSSKKSTFMVLGYQNLEKGFIFCLHCFTDFIEI